MTLLIRIATLLLVASLGTCATGPRIIHEASGTYGNVVVEDNGTGFRTLRLERGGARQSVVKLGDPDHLELSYSRAILAGLPLVGPWNGQPRRILILGLGGGSLPMFFHKNFPEATIDVADISPDVIAVAKKFFEVREDSRLRIREGDARAIVEATPAAHYDVIVADAFGANSAPAHLTTQEFLRTLRRALTPGGMVISNLWRHPYNPAYDNVVLTYLSVFEQNHILDVVDDYNSIVFALPRAAAVDKAQLAQAAGALAKTRNIRADLQSLVNQAWVPAVSLKLEGKILLDKDIPASRYHGLKVN